MFGARLFGDGVCFLQLDAIPRAASALLALRFNNALYETVLLVPSILRMNVSTHSLFVAVFCTILCLGPAMAMMYDI